MGMLGCVVVGADFGNAVVPTPLPRPDCDAEHNSPANRARLARLVLGGLQIQRFFSWLLGTEHFSFEDSEVTFNESHEPLDLVQAHDRHRKYPQPPATWGSKRSCTTPTAEPAMLTVEDPEPPLTAEEQHEPDGEAECDEGATEFAEAEAVENKVSSLSPCLVALRPVALAHWASSH